MEEINVSCPCCWQQIVLYLERDIGDERITIVEDCTVCCRPMEISYKVEDEQIKSYEVNAIEGNSF